MVVGDNGVLTQAQQAKIRTEEEDAKEEIEMEVVGCYDDSGKINLGKLNENLRKKGGVSLRKSVEEGEEEVFVELNEEENQIEELPVTVKYKNAEIEITGEYTGGPQKGKTASQLTPKKDYGQFVDYGLDLSGDGNTKNDWEIFYTDDEGRIFLIAADYVPNNCNALVTAMGEDCSKMIKSSSGNYSVCCEYWSSSGFGLPTYHCYDGKSQINNKDGKTQCSFPEIFMLAKGDNEDKHTNNHYYCSSHVGNDGISGNTNSRCASSLQCTGNWKPFVSQSSKSQYADYAIGGPTLEMWVASWNEKHGIDTEESGKTGKTLYANGNNDNSSKTGYYVGDSEGCSSSSYGLSGCEGYSDTLYFPHQNSSSIDLFNDRKKGSNEEGSDNASCFGYWLASPSARGDSDDVMYVRYDGRVYYVSYYCDGVGVRPVVSLKSDVKVEWKTDGDTGYYEIVGNN